MSRETVRTEGREVERSRATEIRDLCRIAGTPERAGNFIANGTSVKNVRAVLLLDAAASESASRSIDVHAIYERWNRPYRDRQQELPN